MMRLIAEDPFNQISEDSSRPNFYKNSRPMGVDFTGHALEQYRFAHVTDQEATNLFG